MNTLLEFIRGVVRPTLAWLGFMAMLLFVWRGVEVPDWLIGMVSMMLVFWFQGRGNGSASPPPQEPPRVPGGP